MTGPAHGEVWFVSLDPTLGHEQSGTRPALVLSVTRFNEGPAGLVIVAPMTARDRGVPLHVCIDPPEGGLSMPSFVLCEAVRSISKSRLVRKLGVVSAEKLGVVKDRLRVLMDL